MARLVTREGPRFESSRETISTKNAMPRPAQQVFPQYSYVKLIPVVVVAVLMAVGLTRSVYSRSARPLSQATSNAGRHLLSPAPATSRNRTVAPAAAPSSASSAAKAAPSKRASNSTATRAFSGGSMSTQKLRYREPIVFNAREKHTGMVPLRDAPTLLCSSVVAAAGGYNHQCMRSCTFDQQPTARGC